MTAPAPTAAIAPGMDQPNAGWQQISQVITTEDALFNNIFAHGSEIEASIAKRCNRLRIMTHSGLVDLESRSQT